jgi:hypothetical protein
MSNQCKFFSVFLLLVLISFTCFGCAGNCGYESGARVTPAFVAASGARIYVHPPKDVSLAGRLEGGIVAGLNDLGFTVVDDPGSCDLMAYYFYSYDWDQPAYIRDFMIVFKPYPGDKPELMASASCYHRCSSSFTQEDGQEVQEAFRALRKEYNSAAKAGN